MKSLFVLFERLVTKSGTITGAAAFLGVSRSTINRWREGVSTPRAENVLALDAFVRREVVKRRIEYLAGRPAPSRESERQPAQSPPVLRPDPRPELRAADVFKAIPANPVLLPTVSDVWRSVAAR
jgi:hypothetical protein